MVRLYKKLFEYGATMDVNFNTDGSIIYFIFHKWEKCHSVSIKLDNIIYYPEEVENSLIRALESFVCIWQNA